MLLCAVAYIVSSVVMDSESADSSRVHPNPNPQSFFCSHKWRFWEVCFDKFM